MPGVCFIHMLAAVGCKPKVVIWILMPKRTFHIKPLEWNLVHWKWVQIKPNICALLALSISGPFEGICKFAPTRNTLNGTH